MKWISYFISSAFVHRMCIYNVKVRNVSLAVSKLLVTIRLVSSYNYGTKMFYGTLQVKKGKGTRENIQAISLFTHSRQTKTKGIYGLEELIQV